MVFFSFGFKKILQKFYDISSHIKFRNLKTCGNLRVIIF